MSLPERIRKKLRQLPDRPGCYLLRDRSGRIIYVGKAVSLRRRVRSYFREGARVRGSPWLRSLIHSVADIEWLVRRSAADALLTEGQLIKDYKPLYNIRFKDDKRFLLLRADPPEMPFPRFVACRIRREDGARYFGPYASSQAARATLDFVEKRFGLRKCTPRVPTANTHAHCINDVVRYCSAPCLGKVTPEQYRQRWEEACAFLRGERPGYLQDVQSRMEQAAAAHDYEQAAAWRDMLNHLRHTVQERARMVSSADRRRQEMERGLSEIRSVLRLERVPRRIDAVDVSTLFGSHAVAGLVHFQNGQPRRRRYRRFRIRTVAGSDDPGMMAEVVERHFRRVAAGEIPSPDLLLVDGGVAQLHAAQRALSACGYGQLPVVGLSKQLEEIHTPGSPIPVRLSADSPALLILTRIRDEAHRFALRYHQHLRNRRLRESVLDEVPGVGPRKKEQLLRRFGSVRRLARATVDELCAVPGIGRARAQAIVEHLTAAVPQSRQVGHRTQGDAP